MTRKDFELIAKSLNDSMSAARAMRNAVIVATVESVIRNMARDLATTNPRFDRDRFIAAASK